MKMRNKTISFICHHSLADKSNAKTIDGWHRKWEPPADMIGYHYVILKNGRIEKGRPLEFVGAHAKSRGRNHISIGVCFEGNFNKYQPTMHQLEAASRLYDCLCQVYMKELEIDFHRELDEPNPCPGPKLNRLRLIALLKRNKLHA